LNGLTSLGEFCFEGWSQFFVFFFSGNDKKYSSDPGDPGDLSDSSDTGDTQPTQTSQPKKNTIRNKTFVHILSKMLVSSKHDGNSHDPECRGCSKNRVLIRREAFLVTEFCGHVIKKKKNNKKAQTKNNDDHWSDPHGEPGINIFMELLGVSEDEDSICNRLSVCHAVWYCYVGIKQQVHCCDLCENNDMWFECSSLKLTLGEASLPHMDKGDVPFLLLKLARTLVYLLQVLEIAFRESNEAKNYEGISPPKSIINAIVCRQMLKEMVAVCSLYADQNPDMLHLMEPTLRGDWDWDNLRDFMMPLDGHRDWTDPMENAMVNADCPTSLFQTMFRLVDTPKGEFMSPYLIRMCTPQVIEDLLKALKMYFEVSCMSRSSLCHVLQMFRDIWTMYPPSDFSFSDRPLLEHALSAAMFTIPYLLATLDEIEHSHLFNLVARLTVEIAFGIVDISMFHMIATISESDRLRDHDHNRYSQAFSLLAQTLMLRDNGIVQTGQYHRYIMLMNGVTDKRQCSMITMKVRDQKNNELEQDQKKDSERNEKRNRKKNGKKMKRGKKKKKSKKRKQHVPLRCNFNHSDIAHMSEHSFQPCGCGFVCLVKLDPNEKCPNCGI
jgi:hypothetical protein